MKMKIAIRSIYLLILVGLILAAQPASAADTNLCIQDNWAAHGNTQDLTCTANDVRISEVTNICAGSCCQSDGCQPTCIQGTDVTFTADFKVLLTAQERYDIGLYIGSQNSTVNSRKVLTGICNDFIILPGEENGSSTFVNLDNPGNANPLPADQCGDIINNTKTNTTYNPQVLHLTVTTACQGDANSQLKLPNCTSWRTSGQNGVCTGTGDAFPGSPSKCNCQPEFVIDVLTLLPSISVTKAASPTQVPEGPIVGSCTDISCPWFVTYTVDVTNDSTCSPAPCTPGSVSISGLSDNKYGNVTQIAPTNPKVLGTTCGVAKGQPGLGTLSGVTSQAGTLPATIASGGTYECFFQGTVSGLDVGQSFSDTVCTLGATDAGTGSLIDNECGSASVSATDVKPTGAVVKTVEKVVNVECAVIRYDVEVDNTDPAETLHLTALCDSIFGDISQGQSSSPACVGGDNTKLRSGTTTPCVLPQTIAAGGNYKCTFDAEVCTFPHTDTVTGTLNDDENNVITKTGNATVNGVNGTLQ